MSNNLENMEELTPKQRMAGNIIAGVFVIACGVFLLLCGVGVIALSVSKVVVGCLLCTVGLVLLSAGLIQKNSVSLWLSFAFLLPALVELLVKATSITYSQAYPIYISIPAVASLFTMLLSHEWMDHLKIILFFGILAGLFTIQACGIGWSIVLPLLVIYIGLMIVYIAVRSGKQKDEE